MKLSKSTIVPMVFLSAAVLLGMATCQSAQAQTRLSSYESSVMNSTNNYRRSRGLGTLRFNSRLAQAARGHAYNMARQEIMSHNLDGRGMVDRVRAAGYSYRRIAENVAWNQGHSNPVSSVMRSWKNSAGHNRNMLNREVTELGVGVYRSRSGKIYYCQVFGRPSGSGGGGQIQENGTDLTLGRLTSSDRRVDGKYRDSHFVTLKGGRRYTISVSSGDFDTYLLLRTSTGALLRSDDDGGSGTNSRMTFRPSRTGRYRIDVTSYSRGQRGQYRLAVSY